MKVKRDGEWIDVAEGDYQAGDIYICYMGDEVSEKMGRFREMVDRLREAREQPGHGPAKDRPLLAEIEDLVESMDDDDREIANSEGWRSWPDGGVR